MIESLFPNRVLIKDYELSDQWNHSVSVMVKSIFAKELAEKQSYAAAGNDSVPVFTTEHMSMCPELAQLRSMFVDCFHELASAYSTNQLTREEIDRRIGPDLARLPFMKHHDFKRAHSHDQVIDAFAIFYLTEVDNDQDGGELILHDPSFSGLMNFHEKRTYAIATRQHRMVVCPNHIWHEVSRYWGKDDRITVVVNLSAV